MSKYAKAHAATEALRVRQTLRETGYRQRLRVTLKGGEAVEGTLAYTGMAAFGVYVRDPELSTRSITYLDVEDVSYP